ncbi:MAG: TolC family protein [Saccharofermentanaceae bacterium]|jgi:outer membrane protein TolC|nr:TolC family protein [Bacteroidales bacterium]
MNKATLTGIFILLIGMVSAQSLLSLEEAVKVGLSNNFGINIAKNTGRIAANNATPGNAGILPRIDVNAGYVRGLSDARVEVATGSELDKSNATSDLITGGIRLEWTLFDGLDMFITYDKLKKLNEIGDLNVKIEIENTLAKVIGAYYDIVRRENEVVIQQEQVDISKFRLELAQLRYETGSGSELEYLKAKIELNADVAGLENNQTIFLNAKTRLNELLSREINTPFAVKDTILVSYILNYDSLRAGLNKSNRHLILAGLDKEVSLLDMKSARAQQWPTLDFITTYSYYRNETEANFINYNRNFGPTVGATATMKLFDGRNLNREYQNARVMAETSDLKMKQLTNQLEAWLTMAYNSYSNEIEMIGFEQENLLLARKNMDIARESYAVGSISSLQLREIQQDLMHANIRLISAQFRAKLSETELLLLSGKLLR